jgi:hypothetical protein
VTDFADTLIDDLRERAGTAFDEFGREVLDALRESVSVPVQYAGSRVIRSAPGEPPRRETGDYRAGLGTELTFLPAGVSTSIFTDAPLGPWLENGTSRGLAARPHFAPIFDRYAARAAETIGRRIFQTRE